MFIYGFKLKTLYILLYNLRHYSRFFLNINISHRFFSFYPDKIIFILIYCHLNNVSFKHFSSVLFR